MAPRTLKIAVAMRGGVSMAVWLGGAVAELDLMRRALKEIEGCTCAGEDLWLPDCGGGPARKRAHIYRRLCRTAGFDDVEFDILAGASAGGLNAVLFSLAQSYGVAIDQIAHDTWINEGGLWDLIRKPGAGQVPSVLKGDTRLLTLVSDAITRIANRGAEAVAASESLAVAEHLTVELSATLLPDPLRPSLGNQASFSFARRPGGLSSGFSTIPGLVLGPGGYAVDHGTVLVPQNLPFVSTNSRLLTTIERERLALAARATSSFPGAFEPASVYSMADTTAAAPFSRTNGARYRGRRRRGVACDDLLGSETAYRMRAYAPTAVNMDAAFPFARTQSDGEPPLGRESEVFRVIDGGVFDNIPIDRALRAIQRAPASGPSERRLLYLDPEPPLPVHPELPPEGRRRWWWTDRVLDREQRWARVIASGVKLKFRTETADNEIDSIRVANERTIAVRGRLEGLAAALPATGLQDMDIARYIQTRKGPDIEHLGQLASVPGVMMTVLPHHAREYRGVSPRKMLRLKNSVGTAYNQIGAALDAAPSDAELSAAAAVFKDGDVGAALEGVRILIGWVQQIERLPAGEGPEDDMVAALKQGLYRCLAVGVEARWLTVYDDMVSAESDIGRGRRVIIGIARQNQLRISEDLATALGPFDSGTAVSDADFYALLAPAGGGPGGLTVGPVDNGIEFLPTMWSILDAYLSRLREATADIAGDREWLESIYSRLVVVMAGGGWHSCFRLVRCFAASGVPGTTSVITFHSITGSEQPFPSDPEGDRADDDVPRNALMGLRHAAIAGQIEQWVRTGTDPGQGPYARKDLDQAITLSRADHKLAGTALARFGGFISGYWRSNDWQWGRLDAAAGIVGMLHSSKAPEGHPAPSEQAVIRQAQKTLFMPDGEPSSIVTKGGAEGLSDLPAGYWYGLAARVAPMVVRGLWPNRKVEGAIVAVLGRLLLVLLKPVVAVASLLLDPLRAAAVFLLAISCVSVIGTRSMDSDSYSAWWQWVLLIAVILFGVWSIFRARGARRRWRPVRDFLTGLSDAATCCAPSPPSPGDAHQHCATKIGEEGAKRAEWCQRSLFAVAAISVVIGGALAVLGLTGHDLRPRLWLLWVIGSLLVIGVMQVLNSKAHSVGGIRDSLGTSMLIRIEPLLWGVLGIGAVTTAIVDLAGRDPAPTRIVAAVTTALLVLLTFWGWTRAWFIVAVTIALGAAAYFAMGLESASSTWWYALLPIGIWFFGCGFLTQFAPPQNWYASAIAPSTSELHSGRTG